MSERLRAGQSKIERSHLSRFFTLGEGFSLLTSSSRTWDPWFTDSPFEQRSHQGATQAVMLKRERNQIIFYDLFAEVIVP